MVTNNVYFFVLLYFGNLDLVISNDDLYKKFLQHDYKVNFEREMTTFVNESYADIKLRTFKYNRTHFATNTTFTLKIDMEYDLEVIVQAYKFASNEYRIFPLRFEYNYCKGLKFNFAGIKSCARKCGYLNCPLKKNIKYFICNCISNESKLPPFMPTGMFKLVLEGSYKNIVVAIAEIYVTVYRPIVPGERLG